MKPVDKKEFWKERIDEFKLTKPHYSVYVCHEAMWKHILKVHLELMNRFLEGKILDAGCGYGRMAEHFSPKEYVGVDSSPHFIEWARKDYPKHAFIESNLKDLPFKDKEFDWAFCVSIKRMIEDNLGKEEWQKMANELKRVANDVLILEYEDPTRYEIL